jgi:hypothetical protein
MKKKTQTQAQEIPELTPIKGLTKIAVIGRDTAYIHVGIPIADKGQIWRMMERTRMLQILDYALNKYALSGEERRMIETVISLINAKP